MKKKEECIIDCEWINQDELDVFLKSAKEQCKSGKPYTGIFCMKFRGGNSHTFTFKFNQEDGFYFKDL